MTREGDAPPPTILSERRALPRGADRPTILPTWLLESAGLLGAIAVFAVLMTYFGELRADNFYTFNWDLGINQQMLWTTLHGQVLYEAGDNEFYGVHSFLQVHSTYVAFLIAPIYSAAPRPATLFAVQAVVFGSSAIPLYLIGSSVVRRKALLYVAVLVYLTSFAAISALLYDFHWEAFLPLEFLSLFWLLRQRRYALSLVPLLAGVLTLEVFPFLVGGAVLFFLWERLDQGSWAWKKVWKDREARLLAGLLVVAVVSYAVVRLLQYLVVPHLIGAPGPATGTSSSLLSPFVVTAKADTLARGALYWWVLLACLGFLPLLSPRHLILALPWFVNSMLFSPSFASQFGNQYALIAIVGLAVPFVYGLGRLESTSIASPRREGITLALFCESAALAILAAFPSGSRALLSGAPAAPVVVLVFAGPLAALVVFVLGPRGSASPTRETAPPRRNSLRRAIVPMVVAMLAALLVFNATMTPLNTHNFKATPYPGYLFQWGENPVASHMAWLTGFLPHNAEVLASDNLFTLVANDPNAYSVPWFPVTSVSVLPHFPFSSDRLPKFVLVDSSQLLYLPLFLAQDLFNRSVYGLVADVYATAYPGSVFLYEQGYSGPAQEQNAVTPPSAYFFTAANLSLGPQGIVVSSPSAQFGSEIRSRSVMQPGNNDLIWYGPHVDLAPGVYRVVFNLTAVPVNSTNPLAELSIGVFLSGTTLVNLTGSVVYPDQLTSAAGPGLTYDVTLSQTLPLVELRGTLALTQGAPNGFISLNYIEVDRLP